MSRGDVAVRGVSGPHRVRLNESAPTAPAPVGAVARRSVARPWPHPPPPSPCTSGCASTTPPAPSAGSPSPSVRRAATSPSSRASTSAASSSTRTSSSTATSEEHQEQVKAAISGLEGVEIMHLPRPHLRDARGRQDRGAGPDADPRPRGPVDGLHAGRGPGVHGHPRRPRAQPRADDPQEHRRHRLRRHRRARPRRHRPPAPPCR